MREYFIKLWRYTASANERIADALEATPLDEGRLLLAHIVGAQEEWLSRFDPGFTRTIELFADLPLAECRAENQRSIAAWITFLEGLDDAALTAPVDYKNMRGVAYRHVLQDLVAHGINHSTHHRAQIAALIRKAGGTPPGTDYIFYLREMG